MRQKYEKFKLKCGHLGNIIWSNNGTIAVRGTKRSCRDCGKKGKGEWTPTVYIIDISGKTQKIPRSLNGLYGIEENDTVSKLGVDATLKKGSGEYSSTPGEKT